MHNIKDDIARYHSGQLTPAEMHALESRALSDPFLADALEGTAPLSTIALNDDVNQLQLRLSERIQEKTISTSPWTWPLRIAASLLVLISATVVIVSLKREEPSGSIAINELPKFSPPASRKSSTSKNSVEDGESQIPLATDESAGALQRRKNVRPLAPERARKEIPRDSAMISIELAEAAPSVSNTEEARDAFITSEDAAGARVEAGEKVDAEGGKRRAAKAADISPGNAGTLVIKGKVTAEDGSELSGVNVHIKGTNIGTVTDAFGNYHLDVTENDPTLVFAFIGYATEEIDADDAKPELDVSLAEDVRQLSEVVVTGYGIDRDPPEITSTLEFARPAGGKKAYKQYLEKNLRYPMAAADAKVEGRVTIQFAVETTGELSDFKILKGIGNGCDEEVIRLIKAGPKWSPSKRDKIIVRDLVKVQMRFQLPKK